MNVTNNCYINHKTYLNNLIRSRAQQSVIMHKYVPKRRKSSVSTFLATTFFAMILILSVFVYSDFSIPLASAKYWQPVLPAPTSPGGITTSPDLGGSNIITDPDGNILQQQGQSSPFDPNAAWSCNSISLFTNLSLSIPISNSIGIFLLSPAQILPGEELFLQENSIIDVTPP